MALLNLLPSRSLMVSGEVLVVRLNVEARGEEGDVILWQTAQKYSGELRQEISAAVHRHIGPEFDIRSMSFARGSLEVVVVLGTLYYAVSRYKNFIESIELMLAQIKGVVAAFFERHNPLPVTVQGSWSPGPGLVQALPRAYSPSGDSSGLVIWYLVMSHAAMLTVILWLLVRGVGLR